MPNRAWRIIVAAAALAWVLGPAARAAEPSDVPQQADHLLWCAAFYDAWSIAVSHQGAARMQQRLDSSGSELREHGLAALGPDFPVDQVKPLLKSYRQQYAATLNSSGPPRYAPEDCEALADAM
jgi:hypothetical protein